MLAVYIFCFVLGGSLMAISVMGDVFGDADVDLDIDTPDFDLELDAGDVDFDAGGADLDVDPGDLELDGEATTDAIKIFSIRTLIYTMFGFGAVGSLLSLLGAGNFLSVLAFAVAGGLLSGAVVTAVFNYLRRTDTGAQLPDTTFVGLSGTVTLPITEVSAGTVAVERGHRRISLRALPHPSADTEDPSTWSSVIVVEMEEGVARVVPVEEDLALEP